MMSTTTQSGCLGMLLAPFFMNRPPAGEPAADELPYPYGKRDDFLSAAEISFFHVLQKVLTDEHYLLTKVRLADLFFVSRPHENRGARSRINQKHVDFVICDARSMEPLVAVELDDRSHDREDRKERDAFVDRVFEAAELPVLHIPAAKAYVTHEIQAQLDEHIHFPFPARERSPSESNLQGREYAEAQTETSAPMTLSEETQADDSLPICPKCHIGMVRRKASKGKHAGNVFWGCSNYPSCRQTIDL